MSDTATAEKETQEQAPAEFQLTPPRKAPRKGMLTSGLVLLTGLPKSGKNSIALSVPGLVLLETEKKGADHLDGWVQDIPDLATFRLAFGAALKDPNCLAIGVSTLDKLLTWWQDELCEMYQVESMSANLEGVNLWVELRKKAELFVDVTKNHNKLFVVLAHYKEPKLDKAGNLVISNNVDAPGKLGGYICSEADLIGACSKAKIGSKMQFKVSFVGGGEVGAYGGRVKELEGKEIVLPEENQWAAIVAACSAPVKPEASKTEEKTAGKPPRAKK